MDIYNSYLHELITSNEEKSIAHLDFENSAWRKSIIDRITTSTYKDPSFLKTAMVLHMLKYKLGDDDYDKSLNAYTLELNQKQETAKLLDFKQSLEKELNVNLSDFFNDWFIFLFKV